MAGWEEVIASQLVELDAGVAQEPVAGDAERARAEGLGSRAKVRAIGRRRSHPPVPEWARRAAARAGYDVDGPDAA